MKTVRSLVFSLLMIGSVTAQTSPIQHELLELSFVPKNIHSELPTASLQSPSTYTKNTLLFSTGWILHGLKYESLIDDFSAMAPFDARDFEPTTFSELNSLVATNYLLINN